MSAPLTAISEANKKLATQLILTGAIVMAVMGLLALLFAGPVWAIIDLGIAGALGFFSYTRTQAGDFGAPKVVTLVCAGVILLLGLIALANAGAGGGLGFLIALIVLGTGAGLVYAAMLISPGRKLF